jgi:hypothetical protein
LRTISNYGCFFQLIGIGDDSFKNLKKMDELKGRLLDNANFFKAPDLDVATDSTFYTSIMSEFSGWVPQAKKEGLIR